MNKLRIVFIGQNGPFTEIPLRAVLAQHEVVGIVESAYRSYRPVPQTLKRRLASLGKRALGLEKEKNGLKGLADRHGRPYFLLRKETYGSFLDFLRQSRPDAICVASMSQMLKKEALAIPRWGALNLHPSLLPKYRGPDPLFWQLRQMESEGGVTVHAVDEGVDTGNILRQEAFPIPLGMTLDAMKKKAGEVGARLMLESLDALSRGNLGQPQKDIPCPLYARRIRGDEPLIDWETWPLEKVWHILHGAYPRLKPLPPPPGWRSIFPWKVENYSSEITVGIPGTVVKDKKGYGVIHRDGTIRLSVDCNLADALTFLWRWMNRPILHVDVQIE